MKAVVFTENEMEKIKKSGIVKYALLGLATPIGLILSCVLAYMNVDFVQIIEIVNENISNPEILDKLTHVMAKWYIVSFSLFCGAMFLIVIGAKMGGKNDKDEILTWRQTLFMVIMLVLFSQIVLPLFTITIAIAIALLYLVFFSSILFKSVIGYGTYLFALIVEKVCNSSGILLPYGEFIGQERYSIFLTMITFLIAIPYVLSLLLRGVRKFIQVMTQNELVALIFRPLEAVISVNVLRYGIYILLFFLSVYTYSINVSQSDYILLLVKEALLEFVLLDTVTYSIVSNVQNSWKNNKQNKMKRYYISFKYDLEFVLSAINMHSLKNKEMHARIKFSVDICRIIRGKKKKQLSNVDKLLIDISTNYYEIEILEMKIKAVLCEIIDLIG